MERGCIVSVGVPGIDYPAIVTLQRDFIRITLTGHDQMLWNLIWPSPAPIVLQDFGLDGATHCPYDVRASQHSRFGKSLLQNLQTKEMVGVPVRNINQRQAPAPRRNPIGKLLVVLSAEQRIHYQRFAPSPD